VGVVALSWAWSPCGALAVAVAIAVGNMVVAKRIGGGGVEETGESKSSRKFSFPLPRNLS
jgi:hypothetical protein